MSSTSNVPQPRLSTWDKVTIYALHHLAHETLHGEGNYNVWFAVPAIKHKIGMLSDTLLAAGVS